MTRHIVTILFLVAAIALYTVGLALPATGLLILGVLAEGTFWIRLFRSSRRG